jgi:hypothetical protein
MPRACFARSAGALLTVVACGILAPSAAASPIARTRSCPAGYRYAGVYTTKPVAGVAASLTMLAKPSVAAGHVAGWVGVGGAGLGPGGTDEWLQVGFASFDRPDGRLYYELALPHQQPKFVELASGIQPGQEIRVAVLELPFHPNQWVVVTPQGIAGPFELPRSHRRWSPTATGESWARSGAPVCNSYDYRFHDVQLDANGDWQALAHASVLQDSGWVVQRESPSTFVARSAPTRGAS